MPRIPQHPMLAREPLDGTLVRDNSGTSAPARFDHADEGVVEKTWRVVRNHPFLIAQAVVITVMAALAYSATRPEMYTASASILFQTATDGLLGAQAPITDPNRQAATNESLLSLDVVAERAAAKLNGRMSPGAVAAAVSVVSSRQADIVDVQAETEDPALSAEVANAYGEAFKEFRQESARAEISAALSLARAAEATLTPTESAGERGESLRNRINQLEEARSLQTGGAELVQPATVPTGASSPNVRRNGILGGLLGLLIGISLAALRERGDPTIRTVDDLERAYSVPMLARLPRSRALARGRRVPLRGEEAEAFRVLRASLRYFSVNDVLRSLLITSSLPAEGKSTVARHLAETMAAMGDQVVLVDADMHPRRRESIDIASPVGLSTVLAGDHLEDALEEVSVDAAGGETRTLTILRSGPVPANPSELLESPRMTDLMDELQERFDLVIVDSPPLSLLSDALTLVGQVSGIVVVGAVGWTTRDAVRDFLRRNSLLGGNLLGMVANFAPPAPPAARSYYDRDR